MHTPAQIKNDVVDRVAPSDSAPALTPTLSQGEREEITDAQVVVADVSSSPSEDEDDDLPRPGKVWESGGPSLVELLKQHEQHGKSAPSEPVEAPEPSSEPSNVEPVGATDLDSVWRRFCSEISTQGPMWSSILSQGKLIEVGDNVAVIRYGNQHETFVKRIEKNGKRDVVRDAMSKALQRPIGVQLQVDEAPSANEAPRHASRRRRLRVGKLRLRHVKLKAPSIPVQKVTPEMVENLRATQPLVKALMDSLGAQVIKVETVIAK